MKKVFPYIIMLALCALLVTGCGDNTDDSAKPTEAPAVTETETATENAAATEEATATEELSLEDQMIRDSLVSTGNNYRLNKVIDKAKSGEDVTVAFIGGSITEGYNAGTTEIYAKLVYDYLSSTYGTGENVHYVNAGLSGTPSLLGLIRSDRDIFEAKPDLVFIEFAVNDGASAEDTLGFENLIRKALMQEQEPAVIVLYSVTKDGYNAQDNMGPITWHYELPCVSVKNAIWSHIEDGSFLWKDWSNDEAHPNESGQLLYSKFIINLMETMLSEEKDTSYDVSLDSFKAKDYTKTVLVDREYNTDRISFTSLGDWTEQADGVAAFKNGWLLPAGGEQEMTFTFTGTALFVVYKDNSDSSNYCTVDVYVDGEHVHELNGSSDDGWGNPVPAVLFTAKESAEHTVTIKRQEGSAGKFAILAFGVCE